MGLTATQLTAAPHGFLAYGGSVVTALLELAPETPSRVSGGVRFEARVAFVMGMVCPGGPSGGRFVGSESISVGCSSDGLRASLLRPQAFTTSKHAAAIAHIRVIADSIVSALRKLQRLVPADCICKTAIPAGQLCSVGKKVRRNIDSRAISAPSTKTPHLQTLMRLRTAMRTEFIHWDGGISPCQKLVRAHLGRRSRCASVTREARCQFLHPN
jgi:hypothetical protein